MDTNKKEMLRETDRAKEWTQIERKMLRGTDRAKE